MSSYSTGQRVFTLTIAAVFLLTAVATTFFVIYEITRQNNQSSSLNGATGQEINNEDITNQDPSAAGNQEDKLEGTKLADFTPIETVNELQIIDTVVGTGDEVQPGGTVTAHYTGAVAATGVIFQSSFDSGEPVEFPLSQVIKGWTDGVPGMKVGGTRRLVIPAEQAYGANPPAGIPANAPLVFDIVLVSKQ